MDKRAAAEVVRSAIERSKGPLPPLFVLHFVLEDWISSLAAIHRRHGKSSGEWCKAVFATEQMLWSVMPAKTDVDRAELSQSLKSVVTNIREALVSGGCDPARAAYFLNRLATWQLSLLDPKKNADGSQAVKQIDRDTIPIDLSDPTYRRLLDELQGDNVDQIEL